MEVGIYWDCLVATLVRHSIVIMFTDMINDCDDVSDWGRNWIISMN